MYPMKNLILQILSKCFKILGALFLRQAGSKVAKTIQNYKGLA